MKKKLLITSLALSLLLVTGCGKVPKLKDGSELVAEVNGKQITAEEFYEKLKDLSGTNTLINLIDDYIVSVEIEDDKEANDYAESQLATLKLQYEQIGQDFNLALLNNGYQNEDELLKDIASDYKKNIITENYLKRNLESSEIKKYYDEEIFGESTAKHILIEPEVTSTMTDDEKTAKESEAKAKAEELIKQLQNGADFDTLAKENSADAATASVGGLMTNFKKSDVVSEFWNASYELENGKFTLTPVKSEYGYHIILKVSQNEKPKLEDVLEDIQDELVSKKLADDENLGSKTWAKIRKEYNLTIHDDDIRKVYESVIDSIN